jgi:hypothetical protein
MTREKVMMLLNKTTQEIDTCGENPNLRLKATAFTRKRLLDAPRILHLLLHRIYSALQLEIDEFFDILHITPVSKQVLSKARKNLNPEMIREFADMSSEELARDDFRPCYRGMPVIAIDGSDVALENTAELKREFGCSGSKRDAATALISLAYCPMNHFIFDFRIDKYTKDERDLAKDHIVRLKEVGLTGSLLLFDRWYPSAEFIAHLYESGFQFVMRVREKWNVEADSVKTQKWIQVKHNGKSYRVRVLKVMLPTGEIETLLTSLNQKQLPIQDASEIYFKRWGIEVEYDILKSKLQLENFSGKTKVSVLQDFYATIFLGNIVSACASVVDQEIAEADKGKDLKYERKANRNRIVWKLRRNFYRILMERDPIVQEILFNKLLDEMAKYPVPVVPDRHPPRKSPRKKRFFMAKKTVI